MRQASAREIAPERTVDRTTAALLQLVNPEHRDPGEFPMHGVDCTVVVALIERNGATLLHLEDDTGAGPDWISFRYYVRRN